MGPDRGDRTHIVQVGPRDPAGGSCREGIGEAWRLPGTGPSGPVLPHQHSRPGVPVHRRAGRLGQPVPCCPNGLSPSRSGCSHGVQYETQRDVRPRLVLPFRDQRPDLRDRLAADADPDHGFHGPGYLDDAGRPFLGQPGPGQPCPWPRCRPLETPPAHLCLANWAWPAAGLLAACALAPWRRPWPPWRTAPGRADWELALITVPGHAGCPPS